MVNSVTIGPLIEAKHTVTTGPLRASIMNADMALSENEFDTPDLGYTF